MENFNEMEQLALTYHQFYYELLPDWFKYELEEYDYIQQRIGFTLYGIPGCDKDKQKQLIDNQATDLSTNWKHDKQKCKIVNDICAKIREYSMKDNNDGNHSVIYVGVIYNIVFIQNKSNRTSNEMYQLPIFKIKADRTTVWYIDNTIRVYKSWEDYLQNNTLPKCIMTTPKDGVYQCNPRHTVTKQSSTVWIDTIQSPACSTAKIVAEAIDVASSVTSVIAAVGIGISSLFTPIGPVITAAGLISSVVTGGWNIGRSIEKLKDCCTHDESISPLERKALSEWFGITSSVLAIGSNGGSMLLSKAISKGSSVSNAAKIAFNSLLISNFTVNGCGILFQGHQLIYKYQTNKKVDMFDIVMFSSQVLFFSNSLVNMRLANELIQNSNGTIVEKFKNMLRFERLKQQYYNLSRGGESNSKAIIHRLIRISNIKDFLANHNMSLKFVGGNIVLNGISLIDPFLVVERLLTLGTITITTTKTGSLLNKKLMIELQNLFMQLLREFISKQPSTSSSTSNEQSNDINQLHVVFNELAKINNCAELFKMIFKISTRLLLSEQDSAILQDAILFVWEYSKANVIQNDKEKRSLKGSSVMYNLLTKIVTNLVNFIDELVEDMNSAFYSYIYSRKDVRYLK